MKYYKVKLKGTSKFDASQGESFIKTCSFCSTSKVTVRLARSLRRVFKNDWEVNVVGLSTQKIAAFATAVGVLGMLSSPAEASAIQKSSLPSVPSSLQTFVPQDRMSSVDVNSKAEEIGAIQCMENAVLNGSLDPDSMELLAGPAHSNSVTHANGTDAHKNALWPNHANSGGGHQNTEWVNHQNGGGSTGTPGGGHSNMPHTNLTYGDFIF